jgi:hypothetical protein
MMSLFAALHTLAAKRGDGLHPELISALKHSKASSEPDCDPAASESHEARPTDPSGSPAPPDTDSMLETALHFPARPK